MMHGKWQFDREKLNNFLFDCDTCHFKFKPIDNDNDQNDKDMRKAAIIHKIARQYAQSLLCNGARVGDIVDKTEEKIKSLAKSNTAVAFPVGVNINNVVAHDSKLSNTDERRLCTGDLVKLDIGVQNNGMIIDSAFTFIVGNVSGISDENNPYVALLDAARDSMFSAIATSGPDQSLLELSELINEVITSYEIDFDGDAIPIVAVKGIGGHNIEPYTVHGGKLILSYPNEEVQGNQRMKEGEIYAIETFATSGYGNITKHDSNDISHYVYTGTETNKTNAKMFKKTELYEWMKTRNFLPFSYDWTTFLPKLKKSYKLGLESGLLAAYPPLYDIRGSFVAQYEHTIKIRDGAVEIFSLGNDY